MSDVHVHAKLFAGLLGDAGTATPAEVAGRAGVSPEAAAETLTALERQGVLQRMPGGAFRAARLDSRELRELYPIVLLLESTALREAPPCDTDSIAALRAANERLKASGDADEASLADDEFHRALVSVSGNERVMAMAEPVRRALLDYERVYMSTAARRARAAGQHDEIIAALEAGDIARAADLLRENFTSALPELSAELDARGEGAPGGG